MLLSFLRADFQQAINEFQMEPGGRGRQIGSKARRAGRGGLAWMADNGWVGQQDIWRRITLAERSKSRLKQGTAIGGQGHSDRQLLCKGSETFHFS